MAIGRGRFWGQFPARGAVPDHPGHGQPPPRAIPPELRTPISADSPQFSLTAKRVGNAWLVVQGGAGLAQRVQVLDALRINKLDLHHLTSGHATH